MEYANPRADGPAGSGRPGNRRPWILGSILAVMAVGYGAYSYIGWYNTRAERKASDDYSTFMAAVAKADAVADPLQRCLGSPDLPESHWDKDTTRAYCVYRNHRTVRLQDIEALLKAGKSAEVDRIFQGYLDTQRRDPAQPGLLDIAFSNAGFDESSDNARRVIDLWKQQSPHSAFALAASGMQYVDAAAEARGNGWSRDLSEQQEEGMQQQFALAFKDIDQAVSIDPAITAVYPSMIHGAGMVSDDADMYRFAKLALKTDPADFALRMQMMNHAQPKWGDSFGGLDVQRAKDLSLAAKNPLLRMVAQKPAAYQVYCDCSELESRQLAALAVDKNLPASTLIDMADKLYGGDPRRAVEIYSEALRFDPTDADALRYRAQEMIALGDRQAAVAAFVAIARRFPDNNAINTQLGNIYAQVGDVAHAEASFLAVLQREPGNYQAMGSLGDLYNHAGHQPQKAEALADAMIKAYPNRAGGYIVRSCNQMDHNLPGVYDTIHYFIDHFGDDPQWQSQTAEMRGYLLKHPENTGV